MNKELICKICGNIFIGYHNSKYCEECKGESRNKTVKRFYNKKYGISRRKRICQLCNKVFIIDANAQKYCKICAKKLHKERCKKYREAHLEKVKKQISQAAKKWRQTEKGKKINRKHRRKRRLHLSRLKESFTMEEWDKKLDKTNGICPMCEKFIGKSKLELDHIIPVSKAPVDFVYTINDVQPLCRSCNARKSNRMGLIK